MILDYDAEGNLVAVEVLDAAQRVEEPGPVNVEIVDYHQG